MSEIEDGMGFAGLVSTAAEDRQDAYEQRQRKRIAELETVTEKMAHVHNMDLKRIAELEARLNHESLLTEDERHTRISIEQRYEELRSIIDDGSESMTHEDAVAELKGMANERAS